MTILHRWRLVPLADGVALLPPGGLVDGAVRIRDLQRPLRSAAEIFASANVPELGAGAIEPLVTSEGESAAFQIQRGMIDGQPVTRFVGAVLGDDAYTLVVALASNRAAMVEEVARLCVTRCALGHGHRRQRRYRYTPPTAWAERAWGLATRWLAPDGSELVVHPAIPTVPTEVVLDAIRVRHGVERLEEMAASPSACRSRAWRGHGLHVVIVDDGRFRYPLELRGDAPREVLAGVVRSICLVPPEESVPLTDALLPWVD